MLKQATEQIENVVKSQEKSEPVPATILETREPRETEPMQMQTSGLQPTDDCEPDSPVYPQDKQALITAELSQLSVSVSLDL